MIPRVLQSAVDKNGQLVNNDSSEKDLSAHIYNRLMNFYIISVSCRIFLDTMEKLLHLTTKLCVSVVVRWMDGAEFGIPTFVFVVRTTTFEK